METSAMRSRTVWRPGRNEARTRQARAPRRRSRLAGWTWSGSKGVSAVIALLAIRASMAWQGKMPGRWRSLMGDRDLAENAALASDACKSSGAALRKPPLDGAPRLPLMPELFQGVRRGRRSERLGHRDQIGARRHGAQPLWRDLRGALPDAELRLRQRRGRRRAVRRRAGVHLPALRQPDVADVRRPPGADGGSRRLPRNRLGHGGGARGADWPAAGRGPPGGRARALRVVPLDYLRMAAEVRRGDDLRRRH